MVSLVKSLMWPGFVVGIGMLILLCLFGTVDIEEGGQHIAGSAAGGSGKSIRGQTFLSLYDNLTRIDLKFSIFDERSHKTTFMLKKSPPSTELCESEQQQTKTGSLIYHLSQEGHIGQTFTSECPDLKAISLFISVPQPAPEGNLLFHLKATPNDERDIFTVIENISHIISNEHNLFEFPIIHNSQGNTYYFFLETEKISSEDALKIPYTPDETYEGGRGDINNISIMGDLIFKKYYNSPLEQQETLVQINTIIPKIPRESQGEYKMFRFPPISHSKGESYYFFIESDNNMLAPWEVETDLYEQGKKIQDHFPVTGDLTFKVFYKTPLLKACSLLLERLAQNKAGLFSIPVFYLLVFLFYLSLLILFLRQLIYT